PAAAATSHCPTMISLLVGVALSPTPPVPTFTRSPTARPALPALTSALPLHWTSAVIEKLVEVAVSVGRLQSTPTGWPLENACTVRALVVSSWTKQYSRADMSPSGL